MTHLCPRQRKDENKKRLSVREKKREKMCRDLNKPCVCYFTTTLPFILFLLTHNAIAHIFIYGGCSQQHYQSGSPFQTNLNSLLTSLTSSAAETSYNSFAIGNGTSAAGDAVYGLYQCRGDLKTTDCGMCVKNAIAQIGLVCPSAYDAGLQLDGCFIRYENSDFLGKLDTMLVYKKCSSSSSNDGEFFNRRDDVLADLQSAIGFKVSSSGLVQGFSQCLGDLSNADCSSCLAEAVGRLKNVCGSALWGDVYLAQCYVRYWASGYYPHSSPDLSKEDEAGKTVAIIIGVLAGVALIIVLLSFLRKAFR